MCNAWFGSVRSAAALGVRGHQAVMQVKTNSGLFPKKLIADTLDGMPGGVKIVLKGTAPNEVLLVAILHHHRGCRKHDTRQPIHHEIHR